MTKDIVVFGLTLSILAAVLVPSLVVRGRLDKDSSAWTLTAIATFAACMAATLWFSHAKYVGEEIDSAEYSYVRTACYDLAVRAATRVAVADGRITHDEYDAIMEVASDRTKAYDRRRTADVADGTAPNGY